MRLRPEFEQVRSTLVGRNVTSMEQVLGEMVREKTRLKPQAKIDATDSSFVAFPTNRAPYFTRKFMTPSNRSSNPTEAYCRHDSEKGRTNSHFRKRKLCNYCKTPGHIILGCQVLKNRTNMSAGRVAYSADAAPYTQVMVAASLPASSIEDLVQSAL
ncbi:hypothetical protein LINGRAHAP2_LOCUS20258 [Linum grandiflorum]